MFQPTSPKRSPKIAKRKKLKKPFLGKTEISGGEKFGINIVLLKSN